MPRPTSPLTAIAEKGSPHCTWRPSIPTWQLPNCLLDRGADIHAVAMANGAWTVVHFALQSQRSDERQAMINFLISKDSRI